MKTEKQFELWIKKQIDYYVPMLMLQGQVISIEKATRDDIFMEITCTYPYLEPTIRWSDESFEKWKSGKLKSDRILHELCHILTDPLYVKAIQRYVGLDEIKDERERLTDKLSIILRNIINNGHTT